MLDGVRLTLMIGPAVPVPVPREVLDALDSVQVEVSAGDTQSGFELKFSLPSRSPLHTLFLVSGGAMPPIVRVVIVVSIGAIAEVLMDGVMTHHEVQPGAGGVSTLTVRGKDLTAVMDVIELDGTPYPAMPAAARVLMILAKYAALGVVPVVVPPVIQNVPPPTQRIPRQKGTDYRYVSRLARECGYVFYIDPGPAPGTSRAYWGPEIKIGAPQPALNTSMDAHSNVDALSFTFDKEAKITPVFFVQNPETKAPVGVPVPDLTPLNPPLGAVPPLPPKLKYLRSTAKLSTAEAALQGLAYAARHADAVTGTGSLDVVRYGRVLGARRLVGVRGAGLAFDGLYYVNRVTHSIRRGEYKQSFTLKRNGLVSTVPVVPA